MNYCCGNGGYGVKYYFLAIEVHESQNDYFGLMYPRNVKGEVEFALEAEWTLDGVLLWKRNYARYLCQSLLDCYLCWPKG